MSHVTRNTTLNPSADPLRKFSMICGEKTTIQQAMEMEPHIPLRASMFTFARACGGYILEASMFRYQVMRSFDVIC